MLGSTLVGYLYGVAGPFWFAAGCSPMIVFFSLLGVSCKLKIPEAHTLLEIVRIRYGESSRPATARMICDKGRNDCSFRLHVSMSRQQHHCCCEYASGCLCGYHGIVRTSTHACTMRELIFCRTGIHIIAATFLLPVGVVLYTFVGGIKAT